MGSLPNLDHVLERREREKEKVLARERAREREFCHDLDSWRERVRFHILLSQQVDYIDTVLHVCRPQTGTHIRYWQSYSDLVSPCPRDLFAAQLCVLM